MSKKRHWLLAWFGSFSSHAPTPFLWPLCANFFFFEAQRLFCASRPLFFFPFGFFSVVALRLFFVGDRVNNEHDRRHRDHAKLRQREGTKKRLLVVDKKPGWWQ
ncbi:hypothetical protein TW95_gp1732 [Pandoravirus inopinatum]|uniref:Uncharacterized protein n=1 Tax=Pandoravirus inopinatum TaxID=1605721 RepID=A0A0B5JBR0_9VIRU|nr:hypothetical protein TW95_gp1732 [Pandoravirus inopinatum]AJF98466.1 hypothetical protein [Pandoravirus inopinatum]